MIVERYDILNVTDDYQREGLIIDMSYAFAKIRVIHRLNQLLKYRPKPQLIMCDIWPKFISYQFTDWAKKHNITSESIQPANLQQNGHAERYNRAVIGWLGSFA